MQAASGTVSPKPGENAHLAQLVAPSLREWPTRERWEALHACRSLAGYLDAVRETGLRSWVAALDHQQTDAEVDRLLRQHYMDRVRELAQLAPDRQGGIIRWMGFLPYLTDLQTTPSTAMPAWQPHSARTARRETPDVRQIAGDQVGWHAWLAVMRWHADGLVDDRERLWVDLDGLLRGMLDRDLDSRSAPLPDGGDSRLMTLIRDGGSNAIATVSWIVFMEHTRRVLRTEIDGRRA